MEQFSVKASSTEELKGWYWPAENPAANLTLITGMNEYAGRYAPFAEWLNVRGVNVWVLDNFGQGLNAASVEEQQQWPKDAFLKTVGAIRRMIEMARENGLPTIQMGHSMGSFLTQAVILKYPRCAEKYIICGSNGGQNLLMKFGSALAAVLANEKNRDDPSKVLQAMGLGSYALSVKDRKTDYDWLSYNEENVQAYINDPYCGHVNTIGFWREFLRGMAHIWERRAMKRVDPDEKIMIISGMEDPVGQMGRGPQWLYDKYRELGVKDVELHLYEGMRHEILNESGREEVYRDILQFILS